VECNFETLSDFLTAQAVKEEGLLRALSKIQKSFNCVGVREDRIPLVMIIMSSLIVVGNNSQNALT
jgi:hypothetical protein